MIKSFRHKGLRKLAERNDRSGIQAQFAGKIIDILTTLNAASTPEDMNLPGFRNHPLSHDYAGYWGVTVTRNFRIIYRMQDGNAYDVDYLDYH